MATFDEDAMVAGIVRWTSIESPTSDRAAVDRMIDAVAHDVDRPQVRKDLLPHRQRERVARVLPTESGQRLRVPLLVPTRGARVLVEVRGECLPRARRELVDDLGLRKHEMD